MTTQQARQWCRDNGDIPYYETSALENISVDNAFVEMAKLALKRSSQNQVFSLPESIGGAGGAIKLNNFEDRGSGRSGTKNKAKSNCSC